MADRRKAWAVMVVVFVASIAIAANRFKVPPALPALMAELRVDMVTGGWMMSVQDVAGIVLAIPGALLLARIGLKLTGLVALSPQTMPHLELASLGLAIVRVGSSAVSIVGPPALGAILSGGDWGGSIWLVMVMGGGTIISWIVAQRLRAVGG